MSIGCWRANHDSTFDRPPLVEQARLAGELLGRPWVRVVKVDIEQLLDLTHSGHNRVALFATSTGRPELGRRPSDRTKRRAPHSSNEPLAYPGMSFTASPAMMVPMLTPTWPQSTPSTPVVLQD